MPRNSYHFFLVHDGTAFDRWLIVSMYPHVSVTVSWSQLNSTPAHLTPSTPTLPHAYTLPHAHTVTHICTHNTTRSHARTHFPSSTPSLSHTSFTPTLAHRSPQFFHPRILFFLGSTADTEQLFLQSIAFGYWKIGLLQYAKRTKKS